MDKQITVAKLTQRESGKEYAPDSQEYYVLTESALTKATTVALAARINHLRQPLEREKSATKADQIISTQLSLIAALVAGSIWLNK